MARRPQRQRRKTNWSGVTSLITALTAIGALIFTALSLNATRDQVAVTEQGQYTDRYSRAIEQLGEQGPDRLQIRLGGIYALERLAHDSPRDQPTIIEVLATFIRTSASTTPTNAKQRSEFVCPADAPASPLPDVQAALTVLSRRDVTQDNDTVVDLSNACLRDAVLSRADLSGANLRNTDLRGANLSGADLSGTDLGGADLGSPNFGGRMTFLGGADLIGANLSGANLSDADLSETQLSGANLSGANLVGADLRGAMHDSNTVVRNVRIESPNEGRWW